MELDYDEIILDSNEFTTLNFGRAEKSLGLLARKFVYLLQKSKDGLVDIKQAADILHINTRQRRRIYDITNVLEGVGLIVRRSKRIMQWRGLRESGDEPYNLNEIAQKSTHLRRINDDLKSREELLDRCCRGIKNCIRTTSSDPNNQFYCYVTHDDLIQCFPNDAVLVIRHHDKFKASDPDESSLNLNYSLRIQSYLNEIDVRLVSGNGETLVKHSESNREKDQSESEDEEMKLVNRMKRKSELLHVGPTESRIKKRFDGMVNSNDNRSPLIKIDVPTTDYKLLSLYKSEGVRDLYDL